MINDCKSAINQGIADMADNCKSEITMTGRFATESFYAALDAQREARGLTWKKVAGEAGVSASTFTRIAQGRRPDVDTMAALCRWSGLSADAYVGRTDGASGKQEPLTRMIGHLRADPNLSEEGARALEAMLRSAYKQFRKA
jgi:transcriptional regulator with XRE-family HTH domain